MEWSQIHKPMVSLELLLNFTFSHIIGNNYTCIIYFENDRPMMAWVRMPCNFQSIGLLEDPERQSVPAVCSAVTTASRLLVATDWRRYSSGLREIRIHIQCIDDHLPLSIRLDKKSIISLGDFHKQQSLASLLGRDERNLEANSTKTMTNALLQRPPRPPPPPLPSPPYPSPPQPLSSQLSSLSSPPDRPPANVSGLSASSTFRVRCLIKI